MDKRVILKSLVVGLLMVPLGIYFFKFYGSLSADHVVWGEFGSYVSGVYGTLAFLVLAYTANITRKQFKTQNEDNIFFKLYDSVHDRIVNSTVMVGSTKHTAHQTLKVVAYRFEEELSAQSIEIARLILCKTPENISNVHFMKIFEVIKGDKFIHSFTEDKDNFINDMNGQCDFNSKWEQLKYYIGSRGEESDRLLDVLRATGSVNFYKIPFSERRLHYIAVVERISDEYGEFLDGYFKNICFLLEFAANAVNRNIYVEFLKAQITKYELIILFYLVAGRDGELGRMKNLRNLGIINGLLTIGCQSLMIDSPPNETLELELEYVFDERTSRPANYSAGPAHKTT